MLASLLGAGAGVIVWPGRKFHGSTWGFLPLDEWLNEVACYFHFRAFAALVIDLFAYLIVYLFKQPLGLSLQPAAVIGC